MLLDVPPKGRFVRQEHGGEVREHYVHEVVVLGALSKAKGGLQILNPLNLWLAVNTASGGDAIK